VLIRTPEAQCQRAVSGVTLGKMLSRSGAGALAASVRESHPRVRRFPARSYGVKILVIAKIQLHPAGWLSRGASSFEVSDAALDEVVWPDGHLAGPLEQLGDGRVAKGQFHI